MRILTDQDVYAVTTALLRQLGHDVLTAAERGLAASADEVLLEVPRTESRVLVTRGRDFGALVFSQRRGGGVIFLRATPSTLQAVHRELERVLETYQEDELLGAFVVVEPGRHRRRKIQSSSILRHQACPASRNLWRFTPRSGAIAARLPDLIGMSTRALPEQRLCIKRCDCRPAAPTWRYDCTAPNPIFGENRQRWRFSPRIARPGPPYRRRPNCLTA